ncbi:MAG: polysulfide reductase NrfD [Bacillota bacterium]|nr:polysulfide reductase NrfD [Bacillota bacterium]
MSVATKSGVARRQAGGFTAWMAVLAAVALAGLLGWIYQLSRGLVVTHMRDVTSWGLYITAFMFFVGLSAGGLIISAAANLFNAKHFKPVALPALVLSLASILVAAALIIVDLGMPQRILNLVLHPQFVSPLMWDVLVITTYILVEVAYLWAMATRRASVVRLLAMVALPVAVLVHSVTAWIFGLLVARPYWNSAIMAPLFVASALDSGLALLIVVLWLLHRAGLWRVERTQFHQLANLLAVLVPVDLFMMAAEMLTGTYAGSGTAEGAFMLRAMTGPYAWALWTEIGLALVAFVALCWERVRTHPSAVAGLSVLVVLSVFFKRIALMAGAMTEPYLHLPPGVSMGEPQPAGTAVFQTSQMYAPSALEWLIFAGVVATAALAFSWVARSWLAPLWASMGRPESYAEEHA